MKRWLKKYLKKNDNYIPDKQKKRLKLDLNEKNRSNNQKNESGQRQKRA